MLQQFRLLIQIRTQNSNKLNLSAHEQLILSFFFVAIRFPLYCRSSPLPEPMRYAVFLLNQNIGQLKLMNGLNKTDPRETLLNLLQLLNGTRQAIPLLVSSSPLHGKTHQLLHHSDGPLQQLANHHSSSISSMDVSVLVPGNLRKSDDDEIITNGDQRCVECFL